MGRRVDEAAASLLDLAAASHAGGGHVLGQLD
jgi:hypothetical protein